MLSRKHYKAIAKIIVDAGYKWLYRKRISNDMADYFATDNPQFNRQKFLDACGIN